MESWISLLKGAFQSEMNTHHLFAVNWNICEKYLFISFLNFIGRVFSSFGGRGLFIF